MKLPGIFIIFSLVFFSFMFEGFCQHVYYPSPENGPLFQNLKGNNVSTPFLQSFEYWQKEDTWDEIGPLTSSGNSTFDVGRLSFICVDPENDSIVLAGSPNGGLYYTLNKGDSWINAGLDRPKEEHNLDMFTPGIASIVIIHENEKTYWILATGDKDQHFSFSRGVIRSTNEGQSWDLINGNAPDNLPGNWYYIRKLAGHPHNKDIMFAATSKGLYKSENILAKNPEEVKWTLILEDHPSNAEGFFDLEFHIDNPDTMFLSREYRASNTVSGNELLWSTNGGIDWSPIPGSHDILPVDTAVTYFLSLFEVTPANTDVLYIYLKGKKPFETKPYYHGHWKYIFSENKWIQLNQVLHSSGNGRNGYAVSPVDENLVYCATVRTYLSIDGGLSWEKDNDTLLRNGIPKYNPHVDVQELKFNKAGTEIWAATDGGPYMKTIGDTIWQNKVNDIGLAKILRFDQSETDPDFYLFGGWDVGSQLYKKGQDMWTQTGPGDGFGCVFDNQEKGTFYTANYIGYSLIVRNKNYYDTSQYRLGNFWTANLAICPIDHKTIYLSLGDQIKRSTDQGESWNTLIAHEDLGLEPENYLLYDMHVAGYNGNYLYLSVIPTNQGKHPYIFKSRNIHAPRNLIVWEDITPFPAPEYWLSDLEVDALNPEKIWISYGTVEDSKVLEYNDDSWKNISGNLQEINSGVHSIAHLKGTDGGLFAGTNYGIYYRENTSANWILYKPGLPNLVPVDIKINYSTKKILTGLDGRGLWETNLPESYTVPNILKEGQNKIMIYPNPVSGNFEVWSEIFEKGTDQSNNNFVRIYNAQGVIVNEAKLVGYRKYMTFSCKGWKPGIYFLVVSVNGSFVEEVKFIVE
ncbi:MAG: T9SS type A sorting domain-containing protein [Bacteroidales bacterium]|nr:T9SS type A sorting domain-containing protein [Bacteroidales bacterium]